jgi:hypothetical protein
LGRLKKGIWSHLSVIHLAQVGYKNTGTEKGPKISPYTMEQEREEKKPRSGGGGREEGKSIFAIIIMPKF